ncbi:MAG TPA: MMPL family transporter [Solirubrobacterales bacterium]|nr:MMPL family transporter [Solirubrobacterales bacterium]
MSQRLASIATAHPRRFGLVALLTFLVVAVIGGAAPGSFDVSRAFVDPGSDSTHARDQIEAASGQTAEPALVVLVDAPPRSAKVARVVRRLEAEPGVGRVTRPVPGSPLVSRDGRKSIVAATISSAASEADVAERLQEFDEPGVELGGNAVAQAQVGEQATSDLATAELIAFPLLALLTFLFFRGVAALLPLAVGATTVLGAFAVLRAINEALAISPFALNLVIGMGLGLAVDYSLLSVSRFREEMGRGVDPPRALVATLRNAGHTVLFSAVTVAAALACLTVFPQRFLVSMGIGGIVVALVAAAATVLVLPPLLILLAPRLGKVTPQPAGTGRWYGLARWVMRRPALTAIGAAAIMCVLAAPTLGLNWTGVDATSLPQDQSARTVFETQQREFPAADASPAFVAIDAAPGAGAQVGSYARALGAVEGVDGTSRPAYLGHGVWKVEVDVPGAPSDDASQRVVSDLRAVPAPFPALVGGSAAELKDSQAAVTGSVGLAIVLLVLLTCTALWLMTGSVILPIKALIMNFLTLAAATGIAVFVFQEGHLAGLFGAEAQGGIEQTDYLVMAAIVFGLSTDYGVFLLTRIKEVRDRGASDEEAIASGLERTGAIVSAAAVLLAIALGAFVTSGMVFLKELGLGAAMAVLLDAFVVRALLVPSLMKLLGSANWWSPRPLRRLHQRVGPALGVPEVESTAA